MQSSYLVSCPHASCGWTGRLLPSLLQGDVDAAITFMHRAWFRCRRCQGSWDVRMGHDRVTILPGPKRDFFFPNALSSKPARAIVFDADAAGLASLGEALPGWEIDAINGATPDSLARSWNPGAADLLVVNAHGNAKETLGLCRFLSFCTGYSTEARDEEVETFGPWEIRPALRPDAPVFVLAHPGQENIVGAAFEAGARGCLVLPLHPKDVANMLAHARAGNQLTQETFNLDQAQLEDRWRDDGGQG